ncbi:hypothetical protein Tco_1580937, partial [Tanacetum coccineum]
RTSTSKAPTMTQAVIKKLVADSVTAALEAQAITMASASNLNRKTSPIGSPGQSMLETSYYARDAISITPDLVLLYVMPMEKKGIIQISAERPTSMPKEEPTY